MELTLLAAALTGVGGVWITNKLLAPAVDRPTDALIGAAAAGLIVGRLAAMVGAGVNPVTRPGDILVVRGGVSTEFAALAALAVVSWMHRRQLPTVLDHLAPAGLAGLGGWHGGCLWRDACLGTVSDLPWAMTSTGTTITRHPVELYAALGMLLAALVVSRLIHRPWMAAGVGLAAAGAVRLATEPLRQSIVGGPTGWYWIGVVVGVAAALAGQRLTRTRPPGPSSIEMVPP